MTAPTPREPPAVTRLELDQARVAPDDLERARLVWERWATVHRQLLDAEPEDS